MDRKEKKKYKGLTNEEVAVVSLESDDEEEEQEDEEEDDEEVQDDRDPEDVGGKGTLLRRRTDDDEEEVDFDVAHFQQVRWQRLVHLLGQEKLLLVAGSLALILSAAGTLVVPYVIGLMIDAIFQSDSLSNFVMLLVVLFFLTSVFTMIRTGLYNIAGDRIVARLRDELFKSVAAQEIAFFDSNRPTDLINRLSTDTIILQNTISINISMAVRSVLTMVGGILVLFYISWKLSLMVMGVLPVIVGAAFVYGRYVRVLSRAAQDALSDATGIAEETISNIRTVRSFSAEKLHTDQYHRGIWSTYELSKKNAIAFGGFAGLTSFIASLALIGGLWYGGELTKKGEMSPGTLTAFAIYTMTVGVAVGTLSGLYGDLVKAFGASDRIFHVLDRPPRIRFQGGKTLDSVKGVVQFDDVHFAYPSRPEVQVIQKLNLSLAPGKVVALVGPSGGGKSTIATLLLGLYYPDQGTISLDGVDIKEIDPKFLRNRMGIVSQDPDLFACSIADNISYGCDDDFFASTQEKLKKIREAAVLANAHEFIESFPNKYDTMVGEHGVRLSGGQRQRVAIARALLKTPQILILDEATSSLDSESEYLVKQALDGLLKQRAGKTLLVIAHRLSTVKNADEVVVIQKGQVVERGTHEVLLAKDGLYKKLVSRQLAKD